MFMNSKTINNLWREMDGVRSEIDRLFGRPVLGTHAVAAPALNVWEDEAAFYVEADLPDVPADKLDITVKEGTRLTVSGERKAHEPANAVWHRQERFAGAFTRELTLPTPVDADRVDAKFEHGVLKLTLPKSEAARPRKIAVKAE
ncbi:MAG TPA: Hsp20/alpha crystallin family protein [Gemmataceae bacterium]|nr:Hsp20/alpha crystallin family protein [Gemmataceae bacterium]